MKERSLILFTILMQLAAGMFWTLGTLYLLAFSQGYPNDIAPQFMPGWLIVALIAGTGILMSLFHLGTPINAWRALSNILSSWLSREIFMAILFTTTSVLFAIVEWYELSNLVIRAGLGMVCGISGMALIFAMSKAYCLRTIPAWNTWITPVSFFTTSFLLGGLFTSFIMITPTSQTRGWYPTTLPASVLWVLFLSGLELAIALLWLVRIADLRTNLSAFSNITQKKAIFLKLRLGLMLAGITALGIVLLNSSGRDLLLLKSALAVAFALIFASEVLGRALFYEARVRIGV